jgi:hypothetical protein
MASFNGRAVEAVTELQAALEAATEASKAPGLVGLEADALKTLKKQVNKAAAVSKKITDLVRLKGDLPPPRKVIYTEDPPSDESEDEDEGESEVSDYKCESEDRDEPEPSLEEEAGEDDEPVSKKAKTAKKKAEKDPAEEEEAVEGADSEDF